MYSLPAANISKSEISRIEHAWKAIMYRIYGVSTDGALNMVYAYTNCLPICTEMLLRQCNFLTDCSNSVNKLCELYLPALDVWIYQTVLVILALQMFICRRKRCVLWCLTDFYAELLGDVNDLKI